MDSSETGGKPPIKIAIVGTRGIPACYGGFETFAEALSTRLVKRGHKVIVYRRSTGLGANFKGITYQGVDLVTLPSIPHKYFETPSHTLLSFLHLLFFPVDVVLLCNAANSIFIPLAFLRRMPVAINVDGIERLRAKWNRFGKLGYKVGERCSVLFADQIVADAQVISDYYQERYSAPSQIITYGADVPSEIGSKVLNELGISSKNYLLYVSRLEPENNALGVIQAYTKVKTDMPLVIVGDAPYASEYKEKLRAAADSRVIFAGFRFKESYWELQKHCYFYIQATEVGGTHPALVESMAIGNCVIANGTPENREVLSGCGEVYPTNDFDELSDIMESLLADPKKVESNGRSAKVRAAEKFDWEVITDRYEALFQSLVNVD